MNSPGKDLPAPNNDVNIRKGCGIFSFRTYLTPFSIASIVQFEKFLLGLVLSTDS